MEGSLGMEGDGLHSLADAGVSSMQMCLNNPVRIVHPSSVIGQEYVCLWDSVAVEQNVELLWSWENVRS